jgi:GDP-D-mannose dehydratase
MTAEGIPVNYIGYTDESDAGLDPCQTPNTGEGNRFSTYMYGVNTALVEVDVQTGKTLVEIDPKYFRPAEVEQLLGNPTKAKTLFGWNPRQTSFEELVKIMAAHDMKFVKKLYLRSLDK